MQQAYTLHVDVLAEREDGSIFRDGDVRQRLIEKGFENVVIGRRVSGCAARPTTSRRR